MKSRILIIDDDTTLSDLVKVNLTPRGYDVYSAVSGSVGLKMIKEREPDLVILDVMMPEMDGYEVCKRIREFTNVPVLFLTAKGREVDLVRGFEVGGDDYVRKPFSLRELEARVAAMLKRGRRTTGTQPKTVYNDEILKVDLDSRHVYRNGKMVHLTPTEFRLLATLVRNNGSVVTHTDLLREAWGEGYTDATACLSLYVRYLREKIEENPGQPKYIMTKWGVGYWFNTNSKEE